MNYEATSRLATDKDLKIVTRQGVTMATINIMPTPVRGPNDSLLIVPLKYQYRWDLVAEEMLGDPGLKWVVMRHNRIADPFAGPLAGDRLMVPTQAQVQYYLGQTR